MWLCTASNSHYFETLGFHEAIGDTIAKSVTTPAHIKKIEDQLTEPQMGRVKAPSVTIDSNKQDINFLMQQALDKVRNTLFLQSKVILKCYRMSSIKTFTL